MTTSILYQIGSQVKSALDDKRDKSDTVAQAIMDTASNIQARTGDPLGAIAFSTDTSKIYIYTSSGWVTPS